MTFEEIEAKLRGVPFIAPENARRLYDLILENDVRDVLELGIAHGTATCYMAAALRRKGGGSIVAVDLQEAAFEPSAEAQVERLGFSDLVRIERMRTGYTWFLHDAIREATQDDVCRPRYDLVIIDGPKNWTIDGAAFFMADKLLRPDGILILDDYSWTYAAYDAKREATDGISHRSLSEAERATPQVREIFELLVRQHPDYSDFKVIQEDWAIARKSPAEVKETVHLRRVETTYRDLRVRAWHMLRDRMRKREQRI